MEFEDAFQHVLQYRWEHCPSLDHDGQPTHQGITQHMYNRFRECRGLPLQPVRHVSQDELGHICRECFWNAFDDPPVEPALRFAAFDAALHHGLRTARQWFDGAEGNWTTFMVFRHQMYCHLAASQPLNPAWLHHWRKVFEICQCLNPVSTAVPVQPGNLWREIRGQGDCLGEVWSPQVQPVLRDFPVAPFPPRPALFPAKALASQDTGL